MRFKPPRFEKKNGSNESDPLKYMHFSRLKFRSSQSWSRRSARMTNGWTCDWYWVARVTLSLSLNQPIRAEAREMHTPCSTRHQHTCQPGWTRLNGRDGTVCRLYSLKNLTITDSFPLSIPIACYIYIGLFSINKMVNNNLSINRSSSYPSRKLVHRRDTVIDTGKFLSDQWKRDQRSHVTSTE